jgi:hypothetical protein
VVPKQWLSFLFSKIPGKMGMNGFLMAHCTTPEPPTNQQPFFTSSLLQQHFLKPSLAFFSATKLNKASSQQWPTFKYD